MPPIAMTSGNATGSTQIAGAPSCAPHKPTATIASTWSAPEIGCRKPVTKPVAFALQDVSQGGLRPERGQQSRRMGHRSLRRARHRNAPISNATRWIVQNAPSVPTV